MIKAAFCDDDDTVLKELQSLLEEMCIRDSSIQDDTDAPLVCFLYQRCKKFIACLQIPFIRHAGDIAAGMLVRCV